MLTALNTAVTFAIFKLAGKILFSKEKINKYCKCSQKPPS